MMVSHDVEWKDWLRLEQIPGVGNATARKLIQHFESPAEIFSAELTQLAELVSEKMAREILAPVSDQLEKQFDLTAKWLSDADNYIISLSDNRYPPALLEIPDPPLLIYVKGRVSLLHHPMIAIVGSRNATVQGMRNAEQFAEVLSTSGFTISSGLAAGIDAAAHEGALRGIGSTVAVIGTGADIVYPSRNRHLAHLIAHDGCIISEYPLATPAIASNFPRRNRIISGLARGVLVVEAAAQSGSLITARMALEQGREVFAIPGSIHSPFSKGCHQLIKQGAKLVDDMADIVEELRPIFSSVTPVQKAESLKSDVSLEENPILKAIGYDPVHIDDLVVRLGSDIATVSAEILALELSGKIEQLPGAKLRRIE